MSDGIWIITSSAFVDQEMSAEFGHLPPAFLPIGTKRLYEYQLEQIGSSAQVFITLPESYQLPEGDAQRLAQAGATVLAVPDGLSLGDAVVFALNLIGHPDQPVRILHGDTLIDRAGSDALDEIGIARSEEGYSWAEVQHADGLLVDLHTVFAGDPSSKPRTIACGYFCFSHGNALVRGITRARGDFIKGITAYAQAYPLRVAEIATWLDFGHLQTFYRSRRTLASARSFNTLHIDGRTVRKSSSDGAKMEAEANWLDGLPPSLRVYTARLIDHGVSGERSFYATEYEYLPSLAELFVFGTLGKAAWEKVLNSSREFLAGCAAEFITAPADDVLNELIRNKTSERLAEFSRATGFDIDRMLRYDGKPLPSLMQIAEDVANHACRPTERKQNVMHGDFCFSNILYSSRVQRIRVIDPRGYVMPGHRTIYGDLRYDLAKMAHSIIGRYDQIIAGRYSLQHEDGGRYTIDFEKTQHQGWLEQAWLDLEIDGVPTRSIEIKAATVSLFLSMLPLHADRPDRQQAFIANALRLYSTMDSDPPS